MVSEVSCLFLLAVIAVTNGRLDYYKLKSVGLIDKLSGLRAKHGLNFANIEGVASLPKKYKEKHPSWHILEYNEDGDRRAQANPYNIFNTQKFNILTKTKAKPVARTRDEDSDEANEIMRSESLRMCRKTPKHVECKKNCSPFEKPRFPDCGLRSGGDNKRDTGTVNFLDNLEKLLAGNGMYRLFLGCVGDKCRGRSHRGSYDKDRDNTDGREYLGCFGDGCRTNRDDDDDDDTGVRRL